MTNEGMVILKFTTSVVNTLDNDFTEIYVFIFFAIISSFALPCIEMFVYES